MITFYRLIAAITNSRAANRKLRRALHERDVTKRRAKRVSDERRRFLARYK